MRYIFRNGCARFIYYFYFYFENKVEAICHAQNTVLVSIEL